MTFKVYIHSCVLNHKTVVKQLYELVSFEIRLLNLGVTFVPVGLHLTHKISHQSTTQPSSRHIIEY